MASESGRGIIRITPFLSRSGAGDSGATFFVRLKSRIQDRPVDTAGLVRYSLVL